MIDKLLVLGKLILYLLIVILIIFILVKLAVKLVLFTLEKIDDRKIYSTDKLLKKTLQTKKNKHKFSHDPHTGEKYYHIKYWEWQENKFKVLSGIFIKGQTIQGTDSVVTGRGGYVTENKKGKERKYKKEYRIYFT